MAPPTVQVGSALPCVPLERWEARGALDRQGICSAAAASGIPSRRCSQPLPRKFNMTTKRSPCEQDAAPKKRK
eukprot:8788630-Pyramimonas_sp.AAC.1